MDKETCGLLLLVVGGTCLVIYVAAMFYYLWPWLIFGGRREARSEQRQLLVEEVRASGPLLATLTCSGQIGGMYARGPFITVDIHPAGIVLSPFIGVSAIKADQIEVLKYEQGLLIQSLRIVHNSRAIGNPIVLTGVKEDSQFAQALRWIISGANSKAQA
ncbi:MAG: hypothetical protein M3328_16920 [Chloroflexota bacterium]|nr:hypothetical protein [Chloroflexota bacterium]